MSFGQASTTLEVTRAILFQRTQLLAAVVDSGLDGWGGGGFMLYLELSY